jgi:hypothetical protein
MTQQFCTQCGEKLVAGANFCSACGLPLKSPVSQPQHTSPGKRRQQPTSRRSIPLALWKLAGGGMLLLIAVLVFVNSSSPGPTVGTLPDTHDEQGIPYPEVSRIPLTEAKARFEAGTAVFVDVRGRRDYETAHIPKAISLPLAVLEARYQELPRDAELLAYCS